MRISSKGKYAVAVAVYISRNQQMGELVSVLQTAKVLGTSKVYLEQVFSALKKANILESVKGSTGGYRLALPADEISIYDILKATETALFEKNDTVLSEQSEFICLTMNEEIWKGLNDVIADYLKGISVAKIAEIAYSYYIGCGKNNDAEGYMFYI